MTHIKTAAIVGGGIGGLATAIALRQQGIEAVIYERAAGFGEVGAGISLWPNATRVLKTLGVLAPLVEVSGQIGALNIRDEQGRLLLRAPIKPHDTQAICAFRPSLIDALVSAVPHNTIHFSKTLVSLQNDSHVVRLTFEDGSEVSSDIVIGADGIRSTVRRYVKKEDTDPIYRGYPIWRGIGPLPPSFEPGEISESWDNNLRFGLLDLGGGKAYWYATAPQTEHRPHTEPEARKTMLLNLFSNWYETVPQLISETPANSIIVGNTYDRKPQRGWSSGRAVLIGDAAHPTTPNLGQGGGMALEDALVLSNYLKKLGYSEAFQAFEQARYSRTRYVTVQSLLTGRLGLATGVAARLRNIATAVIPNSVYASNLNKLFRYTA